MAIFEKHSDNTKPCKFYFAELTHKTTGRKLYKFGKTFSKNVEDRFDWTRYPERIGYKDFDVRVRFSMWADNEAKAEEYESRYLTMFPRYNSINEAAGVEEGTYDWNNLTGISEYRDVPHYAISGLQDGLFALKNEEDFYKKLYRK